MEGQRKKKIKEMFVQAPNIFKASIKCDKVFQNGTSKICGRQPLKNFKGHGQLKADHTPSNFLKAVVHKFYLVRS